MKKILFIIFNTCVSITISAQCINTFPILTTDPAVTNQQRNGQGKVNKFDWTRDIYDDVFITQSANGTNPICREIYAPWNQINSRNPNVVELIDQKLSNPNVLDIYPADGWELLYVRMGREVVEQNGETRIESVSNPSFSIYNRRTGHIKYFMCLTSTTFDSPRALNITIEYTNNQRGRKIVGALLNHRDSLQFVLPEFDPLVKQMGQSRFDGRPILDEACNDRIWWITADFWTQFDPCTCYPDYETKVKFFVEFIDNKTINMSLDGDITGDFTKSLFGGSSIYLDNSTLQKSKFDGILGNTSAVIDGILKGYKSADGYNDFAMKLVSPKVVNGVTKPALLKGAAAKKILAKGAVFGPKGLIIAAGIGLTYSLIKANKVKKQEKNKPSIRFETPKPITYEKNFKVKLQANGSINGMPQAINENKFVPGSPNQPAAFDYQKPIYNNVLGILSFTELPTLQYTNWTLVPVDGFINQYKLSDNEIKYILNPASGLEIESIKAQLVINLDKDKELENIGVSSYMDYHPPFRGLFQFGKTTYEHCEGVDDFEKQINASGLEISNWKTSSKSYRELTFGTPFVNLPCVHDQTFLLNEFESLNLRVSIKFHVIFKVVNKFGAITQPEGLIEEEEELIEYIVTYPIKIEKEPVDRKRRYMCYGYVFPQDPEIYCSDYPSLQHFIDPTRYRQDYFFKPIDPSPWSNLGSREVLPVSLNFENILLSGYQEFKAQKTITIGNNVAVQSGSDINLTAGESIEVSDLFESEETLHLNIGLDPANYIGACDPNPANYNTTPNLNTICQNNGQYYQQTRSFNKTEETRIDFIQEQIQIINNVSLFPNPTTEFSTVHFNILQDSKITAELFDIKGQLLNKLADNKFYPIGDFEIPLSLQGLDQGVYLLSFTDENGLKTVYKVVKQ